MSAFKLSPSPDAERLITGLRAIAVIGLAAIPLNHVVLQRLLAIAATVRAGDPFVARNAHRLQSIAWGLLALQLLSLVIGAIAKVVSTPAHPLHLDAGFSISGWLAVLLTFVLARVFAVGAGMREDLEGTVTQAHIHLGNRGVTGGIAIWLCGTAASPGPAGTPTCPGPNSGEVTGTVTAAEVVGPAGQGINPGEFEEVLAAMRAGAAYANVHSTKYPPGEVRGQIEKGEAMLEQL